MNSIPQNRPSHNTPIGQLVATIRRIGRPEPAPADNPITQEHIEAAGDAIEALLNWRAYLSAWQRYPNLVNDDLFMSVVTDLEAAGLGGWLESTKLDELRAEVTGVNDER